MSSLETLLEAAKFVECTDTNENGARAPDPPEFHHYAKTVPTLQRSNSLSDKSDTNDEGKGFKKHAGAGTREVHNKLEKNRRAHLKECFDNLKVQIPALEHHNKVSNLSILRSAYKYIQSLKRREAELASELEQLKCDKLSVEVRFSVLQKEVSDLNIDVDLSLFAPPLDEDTRSVSTATAHNGSPIMSDDEEIVIEEVVTSDDMPMSSTSRLSFKGILDNNYSSKASATASEPSTSSVASAASKPVLTLPTKHWKAAHSSGNVGTNHKTIAAMLNTSGQSLLCNQIGNSKTGSATTTSVQTTSKTTSSPQPYPVSLIPAGSLSLLSMANEVNQANQLSQANSQVSLGSLLNVTAQTQDALNNQPIKIATKSQVTQILQKTITQRVQLQQLQKLQQIQQQQQQSQRQPTSSGSSASATSLLLVSNPGTQSPVSVSLSNPAGSAPQVITVNANNLRAVTPQSLSTLKTLPQIQQAVALNQVLPSAFTLNTNQSLLTNSASNIGNTNNTAQPITVTALNKLATSTLTTNTVTLSTTRNATLINQLAGLAQNTNTVSLPTITGIQGLNLATVKPILTINPVAGAQLVSQQVTTLQQLISQATANKGGQIQGQNLVATITPPTPRQEDSGSCAAVLTPVTQVAQLTGGLAPIPVTQLLNVVAAAQGTNQNVATPNTSNITNVAEVLKTLGLPILQQPFSLPVKPATVVVSMANVTTMSNTATTPTIQLNLPVSQS